MEPDFRTCTLGLVLLGFFLWILSDDFVTNPAWAHRKNKQTRHWSAGLAELPLASHVREMIWDRMSSPKLRHMTYNARLASESREMMNGCFKTLGFGVVSPAAAECETR